MSKIPSTICPFCNLGCEFGFEIKGRDIKRVEYVSDSRNQGRLCAKANAAVEIVNHRRRLYHPLIKGKQVALTEATGYLQQRLADFKPEEILLVYDASLTNEEVSSFLGWASGTGCKNLAYITPGPESAFLYGEPVKLSAEQITEGDYVFIVGDAFAQDSVISGYVGQAKANNRGFRYIVVDSFETNTSHFAHEFVQVKPGREGLFLYGLYKHVANQKVDLESISKAVGIESSTFETIAVMIRNKNGILVNAPVRGRSFDPILTHASAAKLSAALEQMTYVPLGYRPPAHVGRSFFSYYPMLMGGRIKAVVSLGSAFPWEFPQLKPVLRKIDFVAAGAVFIPDDYFNLELVLPMAAEMEKQGVIRTLFGEERLTGAIPPLSGSLSAGEYLSRLGASSESAALVPSHNALDEEALDERADALVSFKAKRNKGMEYLLVGAQSGIGFLSIFEKENWVQINPQEASLLDVKEGDEVGIETEHANAKLRVSIKRGVPAGVAVLSMNYQPCVALLALEADSATGEGLLKPSWSKIWKK